MYQETTLQIDYHQKQWKWECVTHEAIEAHCSSVDRCRQCSNEARMQQNNGIVGQGLQSERRLDHRGLCQLHNSFAMTKDFTVETSYTLHCCYPHMCLTQEVPIPTVTRTVTHGQM